MNRFCMVVLSLIFSAVLLPIAQPDACADLITNGLQIHFDAGTITGLNDGDAVTAWADQSGNGRDVTSVSGTAPVYSSNAVNGKAAVRFDGTGNLLASFSENTISTSAGTTVFVVFQTTSTSLGALTALEAGGANQVFLYANKFSQGGLFAGFDGSSGDNNATQNLDGPYNDGQMHLFTAYSSGTDQNYLRADGGAETNSYTDTIGTSDAHVCGIGALTNNDAKFTGDIAEALVYNRTLSGDEIGQMEDFLLGKYAVPEPSSLVLLGLALLACVPRWWRNRSASQHGCLRSE